MSEFDNKTNQKVIPFSNPLRFGLFGPAIILLAFGQATGELVHWPYLTMTYGLFFIFLIIPACLIQYPVFGFLARHTILSGESYFSTLLKVNKLYAVLTWVIFIITSIWIASYTSSGGIALAKLYSTVTGSPVDLKNAGIYSALGINIIFFIILLTLRKRTYPFISNFMQIIALASFVVVTAIFFITMSKNGFDTKFISALTDWKLSLPSTWSANDSKLVITALIFSGLGGLWNVLYSVWLRQEGMGLAENNKSEFLEYKEDLEEIDESTESITNYNKLMSILKRDLWIGLGGNALIIIMIVYIAYATFPSGVDVPTGLGVITSLGDSVSYQSITMGAIFYIFIGLFLMDTWVTAADSLSKLHANMVIGLSKDNSSDYEARKESKAKLFYICFLAFMLLMTFISSFIARPQELNYLNGLLSMFGSVLLIAGIYMIEKHYRCTLKKITTHPVMSFFLLLAFLIYLSLGVAFVMT